MLYSHASLCLSHTARDRVARLPYTRDNTAVLPAGARGYYYYA